MIKKYLKYIQVKENKETDEGKDVKISYELVNRKIEVNEERKKSVEKLLKKVTRICRFLHLPEPKYHKIEDKKYYGLYWYSKSTHELHYDNPGTPLYGDKNYTDDIDAVKMRKRELEEKKLPPQIFSFTTEIWDLSIVNVLKPDDEWIILGTIDHVDGILKPAPDQNIPMEYIPDVLKGRSTCDHCNKVIGRNKTVFIKNIKSGEIIRVGGSCIKYYLGFDYEKILELLTLVSMIPSYSSDQPLTNVWHGYYENTEKEESIKDIIRYFIWFAKNKGYISKASAEKYNQEKADELEKRGEDPYSQNWKRKSSTKDLVSADIVDANTPPDPRNYRGRNSASDYEADLEAWQKRVEEYRKRLDNVSDTELQEVLDFIEENKSNNFVFNAWNFIRNDRTIRLGLMNYITSVCSYFWGKMKREDKVETEKKESQWVGTIGEKKRLENLEIIYVGGFNNEWGWTNIYTLKDNNGNIFTKFNDINPKFIVNSDDFSTPEKGAIISVNAEIKKHDEYKGTKRTVLGRLSKL